MSILPNHKWRIPLVLILLCLLPIAASAFRVIWMATISPDAAISPSDARFLAFPVPILLHVILASLFLILGAFQMPAALRQKFRNWHRRSGRVAVVAGLTFALSGIWMVLTYAPHEFQNNSIDAGRIVFGFAIAVFLILGIQKARSRNFKSHRAWMIRAYALSASSGAQSLLIAGALAFTGAFDPTLADAMMWVGWIVSILFGEWIIMRPNAQKSVRNIQDA
ncbi:MAG: DUF2306 domain-containing protein [Cognatishimia sp.]